MRDEEMRFLDHVLISGLSCSELLAKDFFVARDSISRKMTDLLGIFTLCHITYVVFSNLKFSFSCFCYVTQEYHLTHTDTNART